MQKLGFLACVLTILFHNIHCEELSPSLSVQIPMRDGTELAADLYFPSETPPSNYPCVLIRSPAGRKAPFATLYTALVEHGYVVAVQETRSSIDEEGKTFPYWSDGWGHEKDGYDTIEWLAASEYCNGKIGTVGVSALGITQLLLAPTAPPSLKCQHIGVAAGSLYHHAIYPGGQILKNQIEGWLDLHAKDSGVHSYANTRVFYNDFWENFNSIKVADQVDVPGFLYGGWYDTFLQGTIDSFVARQENGQDGARGQQKLLIGPWTHFWPQVMKLGDFDTPEAGSYPPIDFTPKSWLDYHLKEIENSINNTPPVTYYVMGPFDGSSSSGNVWKFAEQWPVPSVETPFYLSHDQALIEEKEMVDHNAFSFKYDPCNPVPTLGGRNLFIASGPMDQRALELRDDVLVFTSEPLITDLEVTGRVKAKLFFSSNCADTDVVVRLTDVYPDGKSILIADGIFRTGTAQFGKEYNTGEKSEVEVDLWSTSIVFAKGHRIRISVSGSNYPKYEKNHNVGVLGTCQRSHTIAESIIHVGAGQLSHLLLPVVQCGSEEKLVMKEN